MLYTFNPCLLLNTPSLLVHTTHSQSTRTTLTCSEGVSLELSQPIKTSFTNLQQFGKHLCCEEWPETHNMHYNVQTQVMLNAVYMFTHQNKVIETNYLMISCQHLMRQSENYLYISQVAFIFVRFQALLSIVHTQFFPQHSPREDLFSRRI